MAYVRVIEMWNDPDRWENDINDFNRKQGVKVLATQTHVNVVPNKDSTAGVQGIQYVAILYYEVKK